MRQFDHAFIAGNIENKYDTENPLIRFFTNRFIAEYRRMLSGIHAGNIHRIADIGCAEGALLLEMRVIFPECRITACDLSDSELQKAKKRCTGLRIKFMKADAMKLEPYTDTSYDLVTCCEVLEHLTDPIACLRELKRISRGHMLLSVPIEPLWRILNIARGTYLNTLGNTPGHVNHWTIAGFKKLLNIHGFAVKKSAYPLPWQMYLVSE